MGDALRFFQAGFVLAQCFFGLFAACNVDAQRQHAVHVAVCIHQGNIGGVVVLICKGRFKIDRFPLENLIKEGARYFPELRRQKVSHKAAFNSFAQPDFFDFWPVSKEDAILTVNHRHR
ncbi:MAG: hypothetical protein HC915_05320 [Anaerolineae bacterium]|nr:hypothetical protein [Anaerolineae bacterium]